MRSHRLMTGSTSGSRGDTYLTHGFIRLLRMMFVMSCMTAMNTVFAQTVPLQVGTMYAIDDERSQRLNGTHPDSPFYGYPYVEGDLVHIMQCDYGIYPPQTDGSSHVANPLLFITRIGCGIAPIFTRPAKFSDGVVPRPTGSVFARIFNAPTIEEATFYVDSHIHTMGSGDAIFRAEVRQTIHAIDTRDTDNDGLNNSWELSYGTDVNDEDSDDDGIMDGLEHLAGLDPLDSDSNLALSQILCEGGGLRIEWTSVLGRTYRVEAMTTSSTSGDYLPLGDDILATNNLMKAALPMDGGQLLTCYRVKRVD